MSGFAKECDRFKGDRILGYDRGLASVDAPYPHQASFECLAGTSCHLRTGYEP